jgi:Na+/proline symporter
VIWVQFFKEGAYGLYEAIPGFLVAAVATVLVSRLGGRRTP